MVCIDVEAVGHWAELEGIPYTSYADLSQKPRVQGLIAREVERERFKRDDILSEVYQKANKGCGKTENVGSTYYMVGIASVAPVVEAVRMARQSRTSR